MLKNDSAFCNAPMPNSAAVAPERAIKHSRKPVYLVLGCTVFAAAAQVMMKFGAGHPMPNWPLLIGYSLHACNALLLILALRDGELSMLYPIIALTYVWVNILSMYFFGDHMNFWKGLGIALVIGGVALLGRASSRA
jgi:multidrug transporter EmrE-like cation transporter